MERFKGTLRDEELKGEEFETAPATRVALQAWVEKYNSRRPHRGSAGSHYDSSPRWNEGTE